MSVSVAVGGAVVCQWLWAGHVRSCGWGRGVSEDVGGAGACQKLWAGHGRVRSCERGLSRCQCFMGLCAAWYLVSLADSTWEADFNKQHILKGPYTPLITAVSSSTSMDVPGRCPFAQ